MLNVWVHSWSNPVDLGTKKTATISPLLHLNFENFNVKLFLLHDLSMLKKLDIENCHFIVFAIKYFKISRFCYFFFVWTDCGPRFFESMAMGTTWDGSECRLTSSRSTSRVSRTRPVPCSRSPPTINTWRKSLMSKSVNQVTEFSPFVSKSDFRVLSLFITVGFQSSLPLCITVGYQSSLPFIF